MTGYYLKELTVPIPQNDGRVVIRRGKTVEYELDRTYSQERQDTRVTRRVIGKVDPVNLGRMFPNEMYFQLFPENEVPEEVRDEFLRGCEIKRRMQEIRRSPEEIVDRVINGLNELRAVLNRGAFRKETHTHRGRIPARAPRASAPRPPSAVL